MLSSSTLWAEDLISTDLIETVSSFESRKQVEISLAVTLWEIFLEMLLVLLREARQRAKNHSFCLIVFTDCSLSKTVTSFSIVVIDFERNCGSPASKMS